MTVDDLTINWEDDDGNLVCKQLDKFVLSKGAWATIMYLYQNLDKKTGEYQQPQARIVRYRKSNDRYSQQSKFNISSKKQALMIIGQLSEWFKEEDE